MIQQLNRTGFVAGTLMKDNTMQIIVPFGKGLLTFGPGKRNDVGVVACWAKLDQDAPFTPEEMGIVYQGGELNNLRTRCEAEPFLTLEFHTQESVHNLISVLEMVSDHMRGK